MHVSRYSLLCVATLALLALAVFWPGLDGPFLLDDAENLAPVHDFDAGQRSAGNVLIGNRSGLFGRPVAMASFLGNAILTGLDPFWLKLTNLLIHLACGLAAWALCRRLLRLDPALASRGALLAALLAGIWLILPAHVSTVLYVIQRMAQLSALFMLVALWAFLVGRSLANEGRRSAWLWLLLISPGFTALAALSKENGALVPLLALAIGLAYFRPLSPRHWPRAVQVYFGMFLAVPAVGSLMALIFSPDVLLGGYAQRAFTLTERLLSQPRILWDYVGNTLLPYGPRMGLYHDNYPLSTGLLSPPTTLLAILGWLAAFATAWRLRQVAPSVLAGLLIFFGGHAMESSVLPLEPYFEHRNYLPSVGMLLAVAALAQWLVARLQLSERLKPVLKATGVIAVAILCFATFARSTVWSDIELLHTQELRYNPESPRLRSTIAAKFMEVGQLEPALAHIAAAEPQLPERESITAPLWRLLAYCTANVKPPDALWLQLDQRKQSPITQYAMVAWEALSQRVESNACPPIEKQRLVAFGEDWLTLTQSKPTEHGTWRTRYNLARLHASSSQWDQAIAQGNQAWQDSDFNNGVGVFLFQVNASVGNEARCREILSTLKKTKNTGDLLLDEAITAFEAALATGEIHSNTPASGIAPENG